MRAGEGGASEVYTKFEGQSYPVRMLASQFSQRSEDVRHVIFQYKSQVLQLTQNGGSSWTGEGSQGYIAQAELLLDQMDKTVTALQEMSSTLYMAADYLDAIHGMKQQLQHVEERLTWLAYEKRGHDVPGVSIDQEEALQAEANRLRQQIEVQAEEYDRNVKFEFQKILLSAPAMGSFLQRLETAAFNSRSPLDPGLVPMLVKSDPGTRTGRDRVNYLNDIIRMNQEVYEYYKLHPEAKGPNGESSADMRGLALANQNEARREGGTVGVPFVFMHGLLGGEDTFETMTSQYGGASKIYTYKKDGTVVCEDGPNADGDPPMIEFVFEDAAMSFDDQVVGYNKMVDKMKQDSETQYFSVVAHSMGGVITTKYIEQNGGHDILRFVTMGSPITGSAADGVVHMDAGLLKLLGYQTFPQVIKEVDQHLPAVKDLASGSEANHEVYEDRERFNPNIEVLSMAGKGWGMLGDKVVMPDSAFGLKDFAAADKFHTKMYAPDDHSELHEHVDEMDDAMNFLLYGEVPKNGK